MSEHPRHQPEDAGDDQQFEFIDNAHAIDPAVAESLRTAVGRVYDMPAQSEYDEARDIRTFTLGAADLHRELPQVYTDEEGVSMLQVDREPTGLESYDYMIALKRETFDSEIMVEYRFDSDAGTLERDGYNQRKDIDHEAQEDILHDELMDLEEEKQDVDAILETWAQHGNADPVIRDEVTNLMALRQRITDRMALNKMLARDPGEDSTDKLKAVETDMDIDEEPESSEAEDNRWLENIRGIQELVALRDEHDTAERRFFTETLPAVITDMPPKQAALFAHMVEVYTAFDEKRSKYNAVSNMSIDAATDRMLSTQQPSSIDNADAEAAALVRLLNNLGPDDALDLEDQGHLE